TTQTRNLGSSVYQGSSAGSYSHVTGKAQTFNGQSRSGGRTESGQESDVLYQSGTETTGAYSNASYSYQDSGGGTATDHATGPSTSINDTWTVQHTTKLSLTGVQTTTSAGTYTHVDGGGSGPLTDAGTNAPTGQLPGPVVQLGTPDGSLVPVAGAEGMVMPGVRAGGGSGPPVPGYLNLH